MATLLLVFIKRIHFIIRFPFIKLPPTSSLLSCTCECPFPSLQNMLLLSLLLVKEYDNNLLPIPYQYPSHTHSFSNSICMSPQYSIHPLLSAHQTLKFISHVAQNVQRTLMRYSHWSSFHYPIYGVFPLNLIQIHHTQLSHKPTFFQISLLHNCILE